MSSLIKLVDVSKSYRNGQQTQIVLKHVNFEVAAGEMTAIIGASGSGKSTLMNIMGLLDQPSRGQVIFSGENISQLSEEQLAGIRNQKIGFVFQSFFLLPRTTALQNVMLPLFYSGVPQTEAKQAAMIMLDRVGLAAFASHKPNQLSGGQQQRVAIARALVGNPAVILADEPTGALDSETSHEIMTLLVNLNRQEGRTIVIITHDHHISSQCKRIIHIKDGVITQ